MANLERLSDIVSTAAMNLSVAIDNLAPVGSTVVVWWARGRKIEGKVFAPSFGGAVRFESHHGGKHSRHFSALLEVRK